MTVDVSICAKLYAADLEVSVLQNPVITVAWTLCLVQVVLPVILFPFECYPFCSKFSKPQLVLAIVLTIYMTLCCTLGPGFYDFRDIFGFYSLPHSFTYKIELVCLGCCLGYVLVLIGAKRLIARYEGRRIYSTSHHSLQNL